MFYYFFRIVLITFLIPETNTHNLKKERFIGSHFRSCGPCMVGGSKQKQHGEKVWQRKSAHHMVARKQGGANKVKGGAKEEDIPFQVKPPVTCPF